jgi:hypothetical protein
MIVKMNTNQFNIVRWLSFFTAILLPFIAWGNYYSWNLPDLTVYQIFPLLGLWAFCVMVTHFLLSAIRTQLPNTENNKFYSLVTGYFVLVCLLLHPSLFAWQIAKAGYGLPPVSFYEYAGQDNTIFIVFGSVGLLAFLGYEVLVRIKAKKSVAKYWFYVLLTQVIALFLIFIHGLQLGGVLNAGWFRYIWLVLGVTVIISGIITLVYERKPKTTEAL